MDEKEIVLTGLVSTLFLDVNIHDISPPGNLLACRTLLCVSASSSRCILTVLSKMFTNLNLTDMETCYKVFRTEIIKSITIEQNGFGIEPELTAKVAKKHCRIYEVGIS
jgi:hypothetical protein